MDDIACKLATGGDNIKLWDYATSTPLHQFSPHTHGISSLCWSQNNQILVSASTGGDKIVLTYVKNSTTNIINLAEGERQTCLALNSTSRYLVSGGKNQLVSIWDIRNRKLKKTYKDHTSAVTCVTLNWNDTYIASGADNGDVILHNVVSGQASAPMVTPKIQTIRGLEYSHFKKSLLASVSDDGTLNLWDTNARKALHSFKDAHKASATALAFSPVNDMLLTSAGLDKRIVCYDVMGKSAIKSMTVESPLTSIAFMHDGATMAAGSTRGKVYIFDLRAGSTPLTTLNAHKTSVQCVAFQNNSAPKTNGVSNSSSKTPSTVQRGQSSRKVSQSMPGAISNNNVTLPQKDGKGDVQKDVNNVDVATTVANRALSPPTKDDFETVGIISPMRDGLGTPITSIPPRLPGRPEALGKADTDMNDSLVSVFSPLASNTNSNDSATRKAPIGSVSLDPTLFIQHQPIKSNGSKETSNSVSSIGFQEPPTKSATPSPPISLNYASALSPVRDHHTTNQQSNGLAITPEEPVRLKANHISPPAGGGQPYGATGQQYGASNGPSSGMPNGPSYGSTLSGGTPASRNVVSITSPGRHSSGPSAPVRGLLGGSSDSAKPLPDTSLLTAAASTALPYPGPEPSIGGGGGAPFQSFQVEFMKNLIDDSLERFRDSIHVEMRNLQREMVRQFQIQQNEMQSMLERFSVNDGLLNELERLKEENKQLKNKY